MFGLLVSTIAADLVGHTLDILTGFPQSLQEGAVVVTQVRPQPHPALSLTIYYLLIYWMPYSLSSCRHC